MIIERDKVLKNKNNSYLEKILLSFAIIIIIFICYQAMRHFTYNLLLRKNLLPLLTEILSREALVFLLLLAARFIWPKHKLSFYKAALFLFIFLIFMLLLPLSHMSEGGELSFICYYFLLSLLALAIYNFYQQLI
jgi:hypothetical protein